MLSRLRGRPEVQFFAALPSADAPLAAAWWAVLLLRGVLPAALAVAMGALVSAVERGVPLGGRLAAMGVVFVALQVLAPLHQAIGANLGSRLAACLYDRLTAACAAPPGMGHLEDPSLTADLTVARDFDLGMTGPPLHVNMDFIAGGLVQTVVGLACAAVLLAYSLVGTARPRGRVGSHPLASCGRARSGRTGTPTTCARPSATPSTRTASRSTRPRPRSCASSASRTGSSTASSRGAASPARPAVRGDAPARETARVEPPLRRLPRTSPCSPRSPRPRATGRLDLGRLVVFAQVAVGVSAIAFGGLSWALDGAAAPVAAVAQARAGDEQPRRARAASDWSDHPSGRAAGPRDPLPRRLVRVPRRRARPRRVRPRPSRPGTSLAIVGQNGAGKTTLAKLLCRLYDPQRGAIEVDGVDLRALDPDAWRARLTAVFQDFIRFELPLRDNVAPAGAPGRRHPRGAAGGRGRPRSPHSTRPSRGATRVAPTSRAASGSAWRSPARCARCGSAPALVLLDEPTAQLDVRGEAEIFDRILAATRGVTTILISHRFSTVRHADRICVLEHGRVVELGTHDELMARGGRYRTMFDLQARRFAADTDEEGAAYERLA